MIREKFNQNNSDINSSILIRHLIPKYENKDYFLESVNLNENIFQVSPLILANNKISRKIDISLGLDNKNDYNYLSELTTKMNDKYTDINFKKEDYTIFDTINTCNPKYENSKLNIKKDREFLKTIYINETKNNKLKDLILNDMNTIDKN